MTLQENKQIIQLLNISTEIGCWRFHEIGKLILYILQCRIQPRTTDINMISKTESI